MEKTKAHLPAKELLEEEKKKDKELKKKLAKFYDYQTKIYNFMYSKLSEKDKKTVDQWKVEQQTALQ